GMAVFKRLTDILRANINALLEKAEDPEKMLRLIIADMEEALRKATISTAQAMANAERLKARYERAIALVEEWKRRAEEALKAGDEELAMRALEKKLEYESRAAQYLRAYKEAEAVSEKLRNQLDELKAKLEEARTRYTTLIARKKAAEVQKTFAEYTGGFGDEVFGKFERMEERILREEREAEALLELSKDDVEDEYERLERERKLREELEALKSRMKEEG
ncbi:MAG: PspA/IM30 family protein, partial [Thermotogae bacterium]|nr:PspA/IM30 family protein [Thermotogota bacterium]